MKPRRPYLLRALHEWITDSGETPHIVVDAAADGVTVPRQYVKDGKIVLNVSFSATQMLKLNIALPLRNEAELDDLLQKLTDPKSSLYHQFLSVEEFTARSSR